METESAQLQQRRQLQTRPLALHGGQPVRAQLLPYGHQAIGEEDLVAVLGVLRSPWITTGPKVAEFEEAVAAYVGASYAVAFSSGTAALHGAVFAAEVGDGDEAITTPLTFCATANSLLFQGATPVFADVDHETLTLDPGAVERRLTPRTKAIIPMDYGGHPADLEPLRALANRHGLRLIEDACHALGAAYHGKRVGSLSDMTVFSFHPIKHITTGEGGMVTTDDLELARRLRLFRNHGIAHDPKQKLAHGPWYYEMTALGYNYRLSDLACALGSSQLKRLEANLLRRRSIAARYTKAFHELPAVMTPAVRQGANPAWHLYPIRLVPARLRTSRREMIEALRAENIGAHVHYIPVYQHPYYRQRFGDQTGTCPVAEAAYAHLVTLPLFQGMTDADVDDVIEAVNKVVRHYATSS